MLRPTWFQGFLTVGLIIVTVASSGRAQSFFDFSGYAIVPTSVGGTLTMRSILTSTPGPPPIPLDFINYQYTLVVTGTLAAVVGTQQRYTPATVELYSDSIASGTAANYAIPATFTDGDLILSGSFNGNLTRTRFTTTLGSFAGTVNYSAGTRFLEVCSPVDSPLDGGWSRIVPGIPAGYSENWDGKVSSDCLIDIITALPSTLQLGAFFSRQMDASGTPPFTWALDPLGGLLPPGMELSPAGLLSGTPLAAGSFSFTLRVGDSTRRTGLRSYTVEVLLTVAPPELLLNVTNTVLVPGRVADYFVVVENKGGATANGIGLNAIFNRPDAVSLVSSEPPPVIAEGAVLGWDLPFIDPGEFHVLSFRVAIAPDPALVNRTLSLSIGLTQEGVSRHSSSLAEARGLDAYGFFDKREQLFEDYLNFLKGLRCTDPDCDLYIEAHCLGPGCYPLGGFARVVCLASCINGVIRGCAKTGPEPCQPDLLCPSSLFGSLACHRRAMQAPVDPNEKQVVANRFVQSSQSLVYPVHFANVDSVVAAIDVFVTDELDTNLDLSTLEILTPEGASVHPETRTVRWELLGRNLQPGETDNVLMRVRPLPGLPSGTEIRNSAEIQFEIFDSLQTNEVVNVIDDLPPDGIMNPLPSEVPGPDFVISWTGHDAIGEIQSYTIFVSIDGGAFQPFLSATTDTVAVFAGEPGKTYGFICIGRDSAGNTESQPAVAEVTTHVSGQVAVLASLVAASAEPGRVRITWQLSVQPVSSVNIYRHRRHDEPWERVASVSPRTDGQIAYEQDAVSAGGEFGYRIGVSTSSGEFFAGEVWLNVPEVLRFGLVGPTENPVRGSLMVSFSLVDRGGTTLTLFSVDGREVLRRSVGYLGRGTHVIRLEEASGIASGVYVLRLAKGSHSDSKKIVVVR